MIFSNFTALAVDLGCVGVFLLLLSLLRVHSLLLPLQELFLPSLEIVHFGLCLLWISLKTIVRHVVINLSILLLSHCS